METVKIIKKNPNDEERKACLDPRCPLGAAQDRDWGSSPVQQSVLPTVLVLFWIRVN